ncbi:MAG: DUF5132 domain-containing protein [Paracoccaceae bacterium]
MNKSFFLGAAVAAGAIVLIPGVAVALSRAGRPLMRAAVRSGTTAYDEFRKAGAEAYEHMEDIVAEMREEMQAARGDADPELDPETEIDPTARPAAAEG